jgi:hypothetical protein
MPFTILLLFVIHCAQIQTKNSLLFQLSLELKLFSLQFYPFFLQSKSFVAPLLSSGLSQCQLLFPLPLDSPLLQWLNVDEAFVSPSSFSQVFLMVQHMHHQQQRHQWQQEQQVQLMQEMNLPLSFVSYC